VILVALLVIAAGNMIKQSYKLQDYKPSTHMNIGKTQNNITENKCHNEDSSIMLI